MDQVFLICLAVKIMIHTSGRVLLIFAKVMGLQCRGILPLVFVEMSSICIPSHQTPFHTLQFLFCLILGCLFEFLVIFKTETSQSFSFQRVVAIAPSSLNRGFMLGGRR